MTFDHSGGEGRARAAGPLIGIVLLVAIGVCLAGAVAVAFGSIASTQNEPRPTAVFEISADANADRITVEHVAGDEVDVADMSLVVAVEGETLDHQPPVPFFAAKGFVSGPTGPFNPSGETTLSAGKTASFRIASTNAPTIDTGDEVVVELVVDGYAIATLNTTTA